jgi:hypothetical protein
MLGPFRCALYFQVGVALGRPSICIGDGAELILLRHALGGERIRPAHKDVGGRRTRGHM